MAKGEIFEGYKSASRIADEANEQAGGEFFRSADVREVVGNLDEEEIPQTVEGFEDGGKVRSLLYPENFGKKVVSLLQETLEDQNVEAA